MLTVVLYFIIHVCLILAGSAHDNKSSAQSDQELVSQVKDLKSCLLQRDNEIAILVNMVKKGKKNAEGRTNTASRNSSASGTRSRSRPR